MESIYVNDKFCRLCSVCILTCSLYMYIKHDVRVLYVICTMYVCESNSFCPYMFMVWFLCNLCLDICDICDV